MVTEKTTHYNGRPLRLRALRTGGNPRVNQGRELRLRARCGRASVARMPCPSDETICCYVLADFRKTTSTVSRAVLELRANFWQRLPLPGHGGGSETPARIARNARNR